MSTVAAPDRLTHDFFQEHVAETFTLHLNGGGSVDLYLSEISPLKKSQHNEHFSVIFHGPSDFFLKQGMYSMESSAGTIELFIVPVGKEGSEFLYEAVFNRILTT